jgi:hypothetical protein
MGARSHGLANASAALTDEWALWNNPGGLAQPKKISAAFSLHRSPSLLGSNRFAALTTSPFSFGTLGLGLFRFGDDLYNEHVVALGYGSQFGLASLGVRLDYIQYRAEGISTFISWGITFGGMANLTENFSIGASVSNLNQPTLANGEPLPVRLTAGTLFKPSPKFLISAELEKDIDFDPTIKGGVEYQFQKKFMARSGFNLYPNSAFFGIGFATWRLKIDYAMQYSRILNPSHQISMGVSIDKKVVSKE